MRMKKQSSSAIMTRNLMTMVTMITIVMGGLIVVAVGHQLFEEAGVTATHITSSLKKATIDGNDDWVNWRRNSTLDVSSSYVSVYNKRGDAKVKHYFSPHAERFLQTKPTKIPLGSHLYYQRGTGFLYRKTAHARGIYYTLWQKMNAQVEVLVRVMQVTGTLLLLTLVIAPLYIRRLTKKLTDPLLNLSQTTETIMASKEPGAMQLPVPKRPTEVTELADNFNALLTQLADRQERQKLFVMNAAHELRTPIATIRSHAQLIERHGETNPEIIPKSVHYITEESRQMQQLIDELLQLSRADRSILEMTRMDLSGFLQERVQKLTRTFTHPLAAKITPAVAIMGNTGALEQIIDNLVMNAFKYSPQDSQVELTLSVNAAGERVIGVYDQGTGISPADKEHIFERFYRSDEVRGSVPGTGLGLAIVARLVELSGGRLEVHDNEPKGTIVNVYLPKPSAGDNPTTDR
ncbi:HAMP domain-containing sensor histidine kinase [Furfurilactobacillus entadae]|uniref:HAMP domain-containing sensor histidine kinase n=1 Tax=Furfurilactobacillus entadae TaxID=2922307 RepID=UPI0038B2DCAE